MCTQLGHRGFGAAGSIGSQLEGGCVAAGAEGGIRSPMRRALGQIWASTVPAGMGVFLRSACCAPGAGQSPTPAKPRVGNAGHPEQTLCLGELTYALPKGTGLGQKNPTGTNGMGEAGKKQDQRFPRTPFSTRAPRLLLVKSSNPCATAATPSPSHCGAQPQQEDPDSLSKSPFFCPPLQKKKKSSHFIRTRHSARHPPAALVIGGFLFAETEQRQQKRLGFTSPLAAGAAGDGEMARGGDGTCHPPHTQGPPRPMTFATLALQA